MWALFDEFDAFLRFQKSGKNLVAPSGITFGDAAKTPEVVLKSNGVYPLTLSAYPDTDAVKITGETATIVSDDAVHAYITEALSAPELAENLEAEKAKLRKAVIANCENAANTLLEAYPRIEIDSFNHQEIEADAWKAWDDGGQIGAAPDTPILDGILTEATHLTMSDLVDKVQNNVTEKKTAAGNLAGQRSAKFKEIEDAADIATAKAIDTAAVIPVISLEDKF